MNTRLEAGSYAAISDATLIEPAGAIDADRRQRDFLLSLTADHRAAAAHEQREGGGNQYGGRKRLACSWCGHWGSCFADPRV